MKQEAGETCSIAYHHGTGLLSSLTSLEKPLAHSRHQARLTPLLTGQVEDLAAALASAVQQAKHSSGLQQGHAAPSWGTTSSDRSSGSIASCDSTVSSPTAALMSTTAERRAAQAEQQAAQLAAELAATKQSLASYQSTLHQLVLGVTASGGNVTGSNVTSASPFAAADGSDGLGHASLTAAINSLAATGKLNSQELSDLEAGSAPSAQLLAKLEDLVQLQEQHANDNSLSREGSMVCSSMPMARMPSASEGLAYALGAGTPLGMSPGGMSTAGMMRADSSNNMNMLGSRGSSPRQPSHSMPSHAMFRPASPVNNNIGSGSLFSTNNSGSMFSTSSSLFVGSPPSSGSQSGLTQQQQQQRPSLERMPSFFGGFDTAEAQRVRGSRSRDQRGRSAASAGVPVQQQQQQLQQQAVAAQQQGPAHYHQQQPEPMLLQHFAGMLGDGSTTGSGSSPASTHGELLMAMNSMSLASPGGSMQAMEQAQLMQQLQQLQQQQQAPQQYVPFVQPPPPQPWNLAQQFVSKAALPAAAPAAISPAMSPAALKRTRRQGDADGRDVRKAASGVPPRAPKDRDEAPDWRRLFVGNIGWWVDEDALRHWFSDYGTIIDVQVMWNTKLLAKGKKVNREFAFISYSTPEEANTAIHWMHGAYVEGLTKDRDGLTVQYEVQGTGQGTHHSPAAIAAAHQLVAKVKSAGYL